MCGSCSRPCVKSCFGIPLKTTVLAIGIIHIVITVIATIVNVINLSNKLEDECDGVDVCVGPIIKYSVLDALQGVGCGLLLIFGSKSRNSCLLWAWVIIVACISIKYWYVVFFNDWTSMEDWIAIMYLLFFIFTFWTVISFICENSSAGTTHSGPVNFTPVPAQPSVVVNATIIPNQAPYPQQQQMYQQPQYPPQQPQYPPQQPQYPQQQLQYPPQQPQYPPQYTAAQYPAQNQQKPPPYNPY